MDALHTAAIAGVVAKLKAHPGVNAIVSGRVFGPGETVTDPADGPQVLVEGGRSFGPPPAGAPTLVQRDVRVTSVALSEEVLHLLLVAVQRCLNGEPGQPHYQQAVLTHTGAQSDTNGLHSRQDVFGCFCRQPAAA